MKNAELWAAYRSYTEELTKLSRQLAFAAAAICWFFKREPVAFPSAIIWSLSFVVLFFLFDLLQFFVSAHVHRLWTRREEERQWRESNSIDGEYEKPWYLDRPAFVLFNAKIVSLLLAFVMLGLHFISLLRA